MRPVTYGLILALFAVGVLLYVTRTIASIPYKKRETEVVAAGAGLPKMCKAENKDIRLAQLRMDLAIQRFENCLEGYMLDTVEY